MILPVQIIGTPILRKKAKPIDKEYKDLQELIDNMFATMEQSDGIGLAAPQIGKSIQLFVIDATPISKDDPTLKDFKKAFINAEIIEYSGENKPYNEGCLSLPGIREDIYRNDIIKIRYYDPEFNLHEETFDGIKSRIFQHEYDHIQGILFTDKVSSIKKQLIKNKLKAVANGKFNASYKVRMHNKKVKNVFA